MLVEFLRRHALSARTLKDRLNGGLFRWPLRRDYEPTISQGLLNHVGALYITGQLDVALRHAEIMAEVAVALSEAPFGQLLARGIEVLQVREIAGSAGRLLHGLEVLD